MKKEGSFKAAEFGYTSISTNNLNHLLKQDLEIQWDNKKYIFKRKGILEMIKINLNQ